MTHRSLFLSLSLLAASSAVSVACGGSDSSGSSGTPTNGCTGGTGLPVGGSQTSACSTCEEAKCGAQLSAAYGSGYKSGTFGGACQALLQCATACACNDTSCLAGCQSKLDAGCQSAMAAVDACKDASCKAECSSGAGGAGGSGGTGAGGSLGGSAFSCTRGDATDKTCAQSSLPASALEAAKMSCTDDGGTAGTACATSNLIGSCAIAGSKVFYYSPSSVDAAALEMGCKQGGGTWTAG